jgi:hypothetical protein
MKELTNEYLYTQILDFSVCNNLRLEFFLQFYSQNSLNESIELLYRITSIYQFSGSKILENFLYLFINTSISEIFKLEAVKSLLLFYEVENTQDTNETEDEKLINKLIKEDLDEVSDLSEFTIVL